MSLHASLPKSSNGPSGSVRQHSSSGGQPIAGVNRVGSHQPGGALVATQGPQVPSEGERFGRLTKRERTGRNALKPILPPLAARLGLHQSSPYESADTFQARRARLPDRASAS